MPLPAVIGVVAHHLGDLHPYETALVLLVAFGPFLVIALLVWRERRRGAGSDAGPGGEQAPPT